MSTSEISTALVREPCAICGMGTVQRLTIERGRTHHHAPLCQFCVTDTTIAGLVQLAELYRTTAVAREEPH